MMGLFAEFEYEGRGQCFSELFSGDGSLPSAAAGVWFSGIMLAHAPSRRWRMIHSGFVHLKRQAGLGAVVCGE